MASLIQSKNIYNNLKNDIAKLDEFHIQFEKSILPFREQLLKKQIDFEIRIDFVTTQVGIGHFA